MNKSTGPRTPMGKRRSSLNALKHGLHAKSPQALEVMAEEMQVSFEDILEDLKTHYHPMDPVEVQLVRRIARCLWRLANGEAMERRLLERRPDANRPSISYEKVMRYERFVDIHLYRAIEMLERKQSIRARLKP